MSKRRDITEKVQQTMKQTIRTGQSEQDEQLKKIKEARSHEGVPPMQQILRLLNGSKFSYSKAGKNVCYSNAGTNALFSSPQFSSFMAALPASHGVLGQLQVLSRAPPKLLCNLMELRKRLADLVFEAKKFRDEEGKQQDASEWIITLCEGISKELKGDLKYQFEAMFKIEIKVTYECHIEGHIDVKPLEEHMWLQLPVVCSLTQQHLNSLDDVLRNYFTKEKVKKHCHVCSSNKSWKQLSLPTLPEVLLIQYMRFISADGKKLDHKIAAGTLLTVNNIDYELTGVLVHEGSSMENGHYYTITRCCVSQNSYLLNDFDMPKQITAQQLAKYTSNAYMLVFCKKTNPTEAPPPLEPINITQNIPQQDTATNPIGEEMTAPATPAPNPVPYTYKFTSKDSEYILLREKIISISAIPTKDQTDQQKKLLAILQNKERNIRQNFSHLEKFLKPNNTSPYTSVTGRGRQLLNVKKLTKLGRLHRGVHKLRR